MIVKDPGPMLLRWRIQLEEYDYERADKPGVQNSNADALSRIGTVAKEGSEFYGIDPDKKSQNFAGETDSNLGGHLA
jgi:hypothetical protein